MARPCSGSQNPPKTDQALNHNDDSGRKGGGGVPDTHNSRRRAEPKSSSGSNVPSTGPDLYPYVGPRMNLLTSNSSGPVYVTRCPMGAVTGVVGSRTRRGPLVPSVLFPTGTGYSTDSGRSWKEPEGPTPRRALDGPVERAPLSPNSVPGDGRHTGKSRRESSGRTPHSGGGTSKGTVTLPHPCRTHLCPGHRRRPSPRGT